MNFIQVDQEIPDVKIDLFGYTGENVFQKKFYQTNTCLLHADTISALKLANQKFKQDEYQILIIDAYRPLSVQKEIFALAGQDTKYVSDPDKSRHSKGRPSI